MSRLNRQLSQRLYPCLIDELQEYPRIDVLSSHPDNQIMLSWIKCSGFQYCGVIHVADGTPRHAFQLSDKMCR